MSLKPVQHCPGCGAELHDAITLVDERDDQDEVGMDCICKACGWSGDIFPDPHDEPEDHKPNGESR